MTMNDLTIHRLDVLKFIKYHGKDCSGIILNVGSQTNIHKMEQYFPNNSEFINLDIVHLQNVDLMGDAQYLPIRSESVDCVLATEMMLEVEDPKLMIGECYRVLKENGILIVTFTKKEYPTKFAKDLHRFTNKEVEELLENFVKYKSLLETVTNILVMVKK